MKNRRIQPRKRPQNGNLNPLQKGVIICTGGIALASGCQVYSLIAQVNWTVPEVVFLGIAIVGLIGAVDQLLADAGTCVTQPTNKAFNINQTLPLATIVPLNQNKVKSSILISVSTNIPPKTELSSRKKCRK